MEDKMRSAKDFQMYIGARYDMREWMIDAMLNICALGFARERIVKHLTEKRQKKYINHGEATCWYES